jgi:3-methylcrotonyl-CoA carboxylase alpha subunit
LDEAVIWPVRTNAGFLVEALDHPDFVAGTVDTGLIAREGEGLMPPVLPSDEALADAAASLAGEGGFRLNAAPRRQGWFLLDGQTIEIDFAEGAAESVEDDHILIAEGGQVWELARWRVDGAAAGGAADGAILAPMPGRIIAVDVVEGQGVAPGQKLVTLEAMKMEHSLVAPFAGTVAALSASTGGQVTEGTLLVRIDRSAD